MLRQISEILEKKEANKIKDFLVFHFTEFVSAIG